MTLNRKTIDIPRLVADIHAAELAFKAGPATWKAFAMSAGVRHYGPNSYAGHVTCLYTLRAWCRGKLHRQTAPAPIRDFNRSMEETGRLDAIQGWNAREHNEAIAIKVAESYRRPAPGPDPRVVTINAEDTPVVLAAKLDAAISAALG